MMGSSLLALPWGFSQSGIVAGLVTTLVVGEENFSIIILFSFEPCLILIYAGVLCWYSCMLIVKVGSEYDDFLDVARKYLGKGGVWLSFASSVVVLIGALIAYDILMSHSLYLSTPQRKRISNDCLFSFKARRRGWDTRICWLWRRI